MPKRNTTEIDVKDVIGVAVAGRNNWDGGTASDRFQSKKLTSWFVDISK